MATEVESKNGSLALLMVVVPAVGVPGEGLVQDTLKSILVSSFALAAAFAFFWRQQQQNAVLHFHPLLVLPLGLMLHALGSMAWSPEFRTKSDFWPVFAIVSQ